MPAIYNLTGKRVWVAGHTGMVGAAIVRRLARENCTVLTASRNTLDLRNQEAVNAWVAANTPDCVFIAAATVGGIYANASRPAEFLYDNTAIALNILHAAHTYALEKALFLGSSCIYPKDAPQPVSESALMSGALEPTNEWYALAKIAGIKMCAAYRRQYGRRFISAMPCNIYGLGDRYDPLMSHVIPALIVRMQQAKQRQERRFEIWGSGNPTREFLYSEDLADALVYVMKHYDEEAPLNVGSGEEIRISALAEQIARVVGYKGELYFNTERPDGHLRKTMDNSRLHALGWKSSTRLGDGLVCAFNDFLARYTL